MNKIHILTFIFFNLSLSLYSQKNNKEEAVKLFLGIERYEQLTINNPGFIEDLKLKHEFAYEIIESLNEKKMALKSLNQIRLIEKNNSITLTPKEFIEAFNQTNFNPLFIEFPIDQKAIKYYLLGDSGKILVVNSWQKIYSLRTNQKN